MPATADPAAVRRILRTDPAWAVYALADLAPEYSAAARWHVAAVGPPALMLVYRGFSPPVLFAHGAAADLAPLLSEIEDEREFYLSVRPEFAALLRARGYCIRAEKTMWRMVLDAGLFPSGGVVAVRLGAQDHQDLAGLYRDGEAAGEAPTFFDVSMLRHGVYYGIREGDALAAAAGTHVLAGAEGVAAIGNVYTRRSCRGRGFGSRVTAAVAAELLRLTVRLVVLNVADSNAAAVRVYRRLGFRRHCDYLEGIAHAPAVP